MYESPMANNGELAERSSKNWQKEDMRGPTKQFFERLKDERENSFELSSRHVGRTFGQISSKLSEARQASPREQDKALREVGRLHGDVFQTRLELYEGRYLDDTEFDELTKKTDFLIAFANNLSAEMGLFNREHGLVGTGSNMVNISRAEFQQAFTELLLQDPDSRGLSESFGDDLYDTFVVMADKALGKDGGRGEEFVQSFFQGSYGVAASYQYYSGQKNEDGKNKYDVIIPSPVTDAEAMTDLVLFDKEALRDEFQYEEIKQAVEDEELQPGVFDTMTPEAKAGTVKTQVKCRLALRKRVHFLEAELIKKDESGYRIVLKGYPEVEQGDWREKDMQEMKEFFEEECIRKGFDKGKYIVFNASKVQKYAHPDERE